MNHDELQKQLLDGMKEMHAHYVDLVLEATEEQLNYGVMLLEILSDYPAIAPTLRSAVSFELRNRQNAKGKI